MRQAFAGIFLAVAVSHAFAADEPPTGPSGTWSRDVQGMTLRIGFASAEALRIELDAGENGFVMRCHYKQDPDGTIRVEVKGVDEKGSFPAKPRAGDKFAFKWKADGRSATLSDFSGDHEDGGKNLAEGEYKKADDETK